MGLIITIAQQKGGAGKTTLAAQLAVALAADDLSVATLDADPQGSLSLWYAARTAALPGERNTIIHAPVQGWRLKKEAERYAGECDVVIIDSPPHSDSESSIAIRAADLVLIPVQPSPLDVWASRSTIKIVQDEGADALVVLNRVPPRAKLTAAMTGKLDELGASAARTVLGSRVGYVSSLMEGKGVVETEGKSSPAVKEIRALLKEILKRKSASRAKAA